MASLRTAFMQNYCWVKCLSIFPVSLQLSSLVNSQSDDCEVPQPSGFERAPVPSPKMPYKKPYILNPSLFHLQASNYPHQYTLLHINDT